MTTLYLVQGLHHCAPGLQMSLHKTEEGGNKAAAALVNTITEETYATPTNWEQVLTTFQEQISEDADVWITKLELQE